MAYGKIKADTLVYDNSGSDVEVTLASLGNKAPLASPTFTGDVTINAQGDIRLADSDSSNYVGFQSPATVTSNVVWTLPAADGNPNEILKTNGSGVLSWTTDSSLSILDEDNMGSNSDTRPPSQQSVKAYVDAQTLTLIDEDNLGSDSSTRPPSQQSVKAYVDALPDVIDEDNMSSDSATRPPSQQSVKAYVDAVDTAKANLSGATFTGDVTLTGAANNIVFDKSDNALEFADNAKAIFGDGPDLSIYHDTNNSYIEDSGTGALILAASQVSIWDAAKAETLFTATENGSVDLYHNNVKKIETTSTGINVTGTAVVDGITIDGAYEQVAEAVSALEIDCSTGNYFTKTISGNSTFTFANPAASGSVTSFTLELTHSSGTVTWPSSVKWNADTAPTLTAGKTHLFMFVTDDGGTRYRGSALVDYVN